VPGAVSLATLTPGQLRKRRDRIGDYLDVWGDLRTIDDGAEGPHRVVEFALEAPGHDLPVDVKTRYREYYRRQRSGDWLIAKYHYEYLDLMHGARLAYHMHDIGGRGSVPHAHCEPATDLADVERAHHLRAIELDLREAHEQFMSLYAADREPDCSAFLPLVVPRTID
jgi:hypothetical protein